LFSKLTTPHTVRGVGADVLIVDEVIAIDRQFLEDVVLPISANMAYTATIFISTLHGEDDLFGMLMCQPLPNGEMAVDVIRYTNTVCQRCMKRGLEACKHAASQMPPWMSKDKQQRIAAFASERTRAEFEGTLHSKNQAAFVPEYIKDMFETKFTPQNPAEYAVIGADFNAGGRSNSAIVTLYKDMASRKTVVKGFENANTRRLDGPDGICAILEHQIRGLREEYPFIPILICMETNVGFVPLHVVDFVRSRAELSESTFFVYEDRRHDKEHPAVGVVPDKQMKELLLELVKKNLQVGMVLDPNPILPRPSSNTKVDQYYRTTVLNDYRRQLSDYSIHSTITVEGREIRRLHGKHGGRNDDLVSATQFACAGLHFAEMVPRYRSLVR